MKVERLKALLEEKGAEIIEVTSGEVDVERGTFAFYGTHDMAVLVKVRLESMVFENVQEIVDALKGKKFLAMNVGDNGWSLPRKPVVKLFTFDHHVEGWVRPSWLLRSGKKVG